MHASGLTVPATHDHGNSATLLECGHAFAARDHHLRQDYRPAVRTFNRAPRKKATIVKHPASGNQSPRLQTERDARPDDFALRAARPTGHSGVLSGRLESGVR